ncbi:MAG: methylmalonyl-CoA mutase family protein [Deltaproteobacteria bacterium]|nr:methylmalonyl-CoA mutase family protein [Deltaproteobacteria bacterium]
MTNKSITDEQRVRTWKSQILEPLEKKSRPRKRAGLLAGGADCAEIYTANDLADQDPWVEIGLPGEAPFVRGVQANMFRGRLWTMRQYAGFGNARASNERYRMLLEKGQTGLSVAFDLPTQMGRDSDHAASLGEVGKVGVAIDSVDDMEVLFDSIPLDQVSTSMTINSTAAVLLAMYVAVANRRGISSDKLRGTIQNDLLKEYIARGTYVYPPRPSLALTGDIFRWAAEHTPKWNVISVSGYHMREAGCDAIQEVAFTLANGLEYVDTAIRAGLSAEEFASQLSFFFNVHNHLLEEVAKFRAARRLWSELMLERFEVQSERARALKFHCQTAGATLTAQQPMNNIVRVTVQAMAAVMGGCQSLHTNSFDEALGLPTEQSATIALRTQQLIAAESGVADVVDPLGGSYAIEVLTRQIYAGARAYLEKIRGMGGMVAAIEEGYVQREIQDASFRYQLEIERGDRPIVGLNQHISDAEPVPVLRVDPAIEREQVAQVQRTRATRDGAAVDTLLKEIERRAREDQVLMPAIFDAVRARATVGEISDAMRRVYGEHVEIRTL